MVSQTLLRQARSLSVEDRVDLINLLWESLPDVPPTAEEQALAQAALANYQQNPQAVESFDDVIDELEWMYA